MSRSGYADEKSSDAVKQINALGAHIDLLTADATNETEVNEAFKQTTVPIAGNIQGAIVQRLGLRSFIDQRPLSFFIQV